MLVRSNRLADPERIYYDAMAASSSITKEMLFCYFITIILAVLFIAFMSLYLYAIRQAIRGKNENKNYISTNFLTISTGYIIFSILVLAYSISSLNYFENDRNISLGLLFSIMFSLLLIFAYCVLEKIEKIQILEFINRSDKFKKYLKIILISLSSLLVSSILMLSHHVFNIIVATINAYSCYAYFLILKEESINRQQQAPVIL